MFMQRSRPSMIAVLCLGLAVSAGCTTVKTAARKLNPDARREFETALTMAQVHEQEGKLQKAAEIYKKLHELDAEQPKVCHRLGVVQMGLGNEADGMLLLEQANLLDPDNADILNDLGYAYVVSGELEQGEELLRQAYSLDPGDERTTNNLALAAGLAGRYDESLAMYEQIVSKAEAQANLGYIAVQRGEGPRAMQYYSRALDLDPKLTEAGEALAQLAEMKRDVDGQSRATELWAARQAAAAPAAHVAEAHPVETGPPAEIELTGGEFGWAQ
jgi:Flp pilus assembly protein TadD